MEKNDILFAVEHIIRWVCKRSQLEYKDGVGEYFYNALTNFDFEKKDQTKRRIKPITEMCVSLWTSGEKLNNREFRSILNEAIRTDDPDVLDHVTVLSRGISTLCVVDRSMVRYVKWPEDNKCYRGGDLPDDKQKFYDEVKHY